MSETNEIMAALNHFVQEYASHSEVITSTAGQNINATQAHLLMLLRTQSLTNTQLATSVGLSRPAITKAIKNLIAHNYVIATIDDTDKRSTFYSLTPVGDQLAVRHEAAHQSMLNHLNTIMTNFSPKQQKTITKFLEQLNQIGDNQ
ncbi:MarR family transcriptional regulator [Leuconostoc falkenbergense]|uniref:MarR family winged helix-turn-helix transcriptional regulator n=1 Tax=Leuconostoc falkenbergense TaxID=2766470 RepID=UPI00166AD5E0|nr:MarR family transcriptional regulator [Leuconostoc falkenbergense]MCT4404837.1 MarR family transcriptional regulator [Leuconostoc falkenbergense]